MTSRDPSSPGFSPLTGALVLALALTGCASTDGDTKSGDRVDYRSSKARAQPLDVPPDLTQLSRESRFQVIQPGSVSASTFQGSAAGAAAPPAAGTASPGTPPGAAPAVAVAPASLGSLRIERIGDQRWLVAAASPEQLWPQLQAFWRDNGFTLTTDEPAAGVMETNWAENRAQIPQDFLRRTIGRVFDGAWSTSERDRFRTRLERVSGGTEIYVSHRGMEEIYTDQQKTQTIWQPRARDPELEAVFLARLMNKLGGVEVAAAKATVAAAPPAASPARARVLDGRAGAALQVDDPFDRAWRRVGLALDRGGFTVEDRDRAAGLYFVRYVPASDPSNNPPGLFTRLFGGSGPTPVASRLRVEVKGDGGNSIVSVLNAQGTADNTDTAKRIVALLVDDLK